MQGNGFPNNNRSCSIILDSSKDSQTSALKERRQPLIERESSLPAIGHSMTGGGEGPSVVKVATSFPAPLLGAMGDLKKCLNFQMKKKEGEKESKFSENFKQRDLLFLSPTGLL